jgi:methylthioribulose-1-phosphate dehydratase
VISKLYASQLGLKLRNYELLKALAGVKTHKHIETLPIFANTQNIKLLATEVEQYMNINPEIHGYLIEGHGLYTWGSSQAEALRHIEVFETLFEIEIKMHDWIKAG